uniref:Rubredoxin-like domain-containing protein n=1 Tax=Eucampia antarctica TaxID=49252 RepID=A0A7S2RGK5_9STRA|mmetsp:Transcript_2192/g.2028  ORF Transcript_2192/g.2028 Transcript_2192/m.2028 type:complete len:196 (+) Transcript_2192:60-647(+)|eukprot:CAMPEP_0197833554 /NCGR_PEP_ID=MMETSP1437-20131217/19446_1 /TAXON_ID=49252 ORGANISM="Eucampia antarctica, Strain CCMP1452" /NCGR_SAMPLE_ID=MMETSP1437 /ASSEMBLY_ACC=CAM_ASM_001096 /LENGTH=195 /DNA_ID=CAMNT_0043437679 /DNA_START=50 /DNA_END=637 /DNA_ORIENTATION=+
MQPVTLLTVLAMACFSANAFAPLTMPSSSKLLLSNRGRVSTNHVVRRMSEEPTKAEVETTEEEEEIDVASRLAIEKQKKTDLLRSQEVFMKRSTGKHQCTVCDWEFDETKGDSFMIGGLIQPGTKFDDLASNFRCPSCRASKDKFLEITEEIPGFEVNQGYGFGTNSMTAGQKNLLIFGGLGLFFVLFLSGYAMS